jgi:hypothetical protein
MVLDMNILRLEWAMRTSNRRSCLALALLATMGAAQGQTPEEEAVARLPRDVQALLANLPAREALQKYDYARQNLIALGAPNPSPERLRAQVEAVIAPRYASVRSASAGTTSFPPLSPLVPANAFDYR